MTVIDVVGVALMFAVSVAVIVSSFVTARSECRTNRELLRVQPYGFRVASREAFLAELRAMAAALERDARCRICTAYPKNSNVTVSVTFARDGRFSRNALSSTWLVAVKPGLRFDEGMNAKEDYELQIRELAQGRSILRDNLLAPNTASRITAAGTKGGRGFTYGSK